MSSVILTSGSLVIAVCRGDSAGETRGNLGNHPIPSDRTKPPSINGFFANKKPHFDASSMSGGPI